MRKLGWVVAVIGMASSLAAGCGGALDTDLFDAATGKDAAADSTLDTGTSDVSVADIITEACAVHCSADLHSVVDCNDNVLTSCPAGQGCGSGGTCVPACDAVTSANDHRGCEFYSVVPDVLPNNNLEGGCYVVMVVNAWTTPMTVSVDRAGSPITGDFLRIPSGSGQSMTYAAPTNNQIPAGSTGLLFLSQSPNAKPTCPGGVTPGMATDPAAHGTAYGDAFHVTTSMPATASDFVPYGAGAYIASASLLLPSHAWTKNYVVVDAYQASAIAAGIPSTDIVAMQNGTHVTIKPTAAIVASNTVTAANAGTPTIYTLDKGQVLQVTQKAELTGSPIESDAPIAVWGAHTCMNIDPSTGYCDSGHQQLPPVSMIGHEYVGVRYRNRSTTDETPPWRLVGLADGTQLTWDQPTAGAPATLSAGQLASVNAAGPFLVTSQDEQHPFYLSAHMTGGAPFNSVGDPEFVNVVPAVQWLNAYSLFTQPSFPETNLVVVRSNGQSGFQDVTLDCAGTLAGWQPVGNGQRYQYTRIDLSIGNFVAQNGCDNGVHTASSSGPFTLTTWSWGNTVTGTYATSYALPAGMDTRTATSITMPAK